MHVLCPWVLVYCVHRFVRVCTVSFCLFVWLILFHCVQNEVALPSLELELLASGEPRGQLCTSTWLKVGFHKGDKLKWKGEKHTDSATLNLRKNISCCTEWAQNSLK